MHENFSSIKETLSSRGIFFYFSGPLSQTLLVELGDTLKHNMQLASASQSTILKVFGVVVEQSQNILHYSAEQVPPDGNTESLPPLKIGTIAVGFRDNEYFVLCGNLIGNQHVERLSKNLEMLNSMSKEELKKYYKEQRRLDPHDESKGAGLGFIEMARKASSPLEFEFEKVDDVYSFFSVKTII